MEKNEKITNNENNEIKKQNEVNYAKISESEVKIDLKTKRNLKSQNEILEKEISELSEICLGIKDNIYTSNERLNKTLTEIKNRENQRDKLQSQLDKIKNDPLGKETGDYIKKQKESLMRKHLDEIISEKIPELNKNQEENSKDFESYKNLMYDYLNLTFCDYADNIPPSAVSNKHMIGSKLNSSIINSNNNKNNNLNSNLIDNDINNINNNNKNLNFIKDNYNSNNINADILQTSNNLIDNYNSNGNKDTNKNDNGQINNINSKDDNTNKNDKNDKNFEVNSNVINNQIIKAKKQNFEKQAFRISSKTTFFELKQVACDFFRLSDYKSYIITDQAESIFIDEAYNINEYLFEFSVFSNNFKLVSLAFLKNRPELINVQKVNIKLLNNKLLDGQSQGNQAYAVSGGSGYDSTLGKIRVFFNEYFGLKPFILNEGEEKSEGVKDPSQNSSLFSASLVTKIDTSFAMMIVLLLFYLSTIVFIYASRDIGRNNLKITFLTNFFTNKEVFNYKSLYAFLINKVAFRFNKIEFPQNANNNLQTYLEAFELLGYNDYILNNNSTNNSNKAIDFNKLMIDMQNYRNNQIQFFYASSFHLILNKVQEKLCSQTQFALNLGIGDKCFYDFYNVNTQLEQDILIKQFDDLQEIDGKNLFADLEKFKTSEQAKVFLNFDSLSGHYDGSGYHTDISKNITYLPVHSSFNGPKKTANISKKDDINNYALTDFSTRSIMLIFNIYFPSDEVFANVLIPFDFLSTGLIKPGKMEISAFQGNVYKHSTNVIADILRIVIVVFLSVIMTFEIKQTFAMTKDLKYSILNPKNVLTVFTILLFIISLFYRLIYLSFNEEEILKGNGFTYVDTYYVASIYTTVYLIECLLFAAVSLKLLIFLKLNETIRLFYTTIENAFISFIKYSVFLLVVLTGYTVISYIIWGPFIKEYSTFGSAFVQVLMMTMGYIRTDMLLTYNSWWTIFYIISFFIFIILYMYSIFISLYYENLRKNVIKNGYPEDHEKTKWTLTDYIKWITNIRGETKKRPEDEEN